MNVEFSLLMKLKCLVSTVGAIGAVGDTFMAIHKVTFDWLVEVLYDETFEEIEESARLVEIIVD